MSDVWVSEAACIELLGDEKTQSFINQFGGTSMYIPRKPSKDHSIAQTVGFISMAALCREYGGLNAIITNARNKGTKKTRIIKLIDQGLPSPKIATLAESSIRYVRMIKKEYRKLS